jgi:hypothetical protein
MTKAPCIVLLVALKHKRKLAALRHMMGEEDSGGKEAEKKSPDMSDGFSVGVTERSPGFNKVPRS